MRMIPMMITMDTMISLMNSLKIHRNGTIQTEIHWVTTQTQMMITTGFLISMTHSLTIP